MPSKLSVSIVVFHPDPKQLRLTFRSLIESIQDAQRAGLVEEVVLDVIDNGGTERTTTTSLAMQEECEGRRGIRAALHRQERNVGYGVAHNSSIRRSRSSFHLVLNPDVLMARNAIRRAIQFMSAHPEVGLIGPGARDARGMPQRLCKRYPSVLALALRGFAPAPVRALFAPYLRRYELRDVVDREPHVGVPIVAGTFMFYRTALLQRLGGFDERFFLYFEDFDLSVRTNRHARIAYLPDLHVTHFGGGASRKGLRHIAMFVRSAWTFFNLHGWQFVSLDDRGLKNTDNRLSVREARSARYQ